MIVDIIIVVVIIIVLLILTTLLFVVCLLVCLLLFVEKRVEWLLFVTVFVCFVFVCVLLFAVVRCCWFGSPRNVSGLVLANVIHPSILPVLTRRSSVIGSARSGWDRYARRYGTLPPPPPLRRRWLGSDVGLVGDTQPTGLVVPFRAWPKLARRSRPSPFLLE